MKIFDSHCHYNLEPLSSSSAPELYLTHLQQAKSHGVTQSVVVGTSLVSSQLALSQASQQDSLFAAVGIHPGEITPTSSSAQLDSELIKLHELSLKPKVVAIGETGLDYFQLKKSGVEKKQLSFVQELQKNYFSHQLELAKKRQLTLVIHVRDVDEQAYNDVLEILKKSLSSDQKFILHCVSGPLEYVEQAIEMGGYIGISGNVTYKSADHIRQIAKTVPADRILLETDAPYLPPSEYRGQICQPWMISLTAAFLQDSLGLSLEEIYANTCRVFGVSP